MEPARASLPTDAASRKASPLAEGLLWYFPNALAAIAAVSKAGNDQHNPGQPMHHSRGKSSDHADCALRHLIDAGTIDTDGMRHTAKAAWRLLALLQEEIEAQEGVPLPRNARAAMTEPQRQATHDALMTGHWHQCDHKGCIWTLLTGWSCGQNTTASPRTPVSQTTGD